MTSAPQAPDTKARVLGCLLGGALGDALGGPYENRRPPFDVVPDEQCWKLSDDTQLTLATCEAIISAGRVDPEGIAAKFGEGHRRRRFSGVGASTLKALTELAAGGHWALVGRRGEHAAGNGAAMRIAPLAFLCSPDDEEGRQSIRDVCRITHHHDEAYAGALAVVAAIRAAWSGVWPANPAILDVVGAVLPDTAVRDRLCEVAACRKLSLTEVGRQFGTSGHVVDSVPFAIAAAERVEQGFDRVLMELVGCGGDTDTIASIAGQIMGATLGIERLPAIWVSRLRGEPGLLATAKRFAETVPQPT